MNKKDRDATTPCGCTIYGGETDPLPVPYKYVTPTFDRKEWTAQAEGIVGG